MVVAGYLSNAKLLPPTHEVASGPAAIEKFIAGLHDNGVTDHKLEVIDAGGDDKVLYGTAKRSAKGKDKDGKPDLRWHRHARARAPSGQLAEN